jgi:acetyltransferase-like isoleucine patch superfamily enzyme
MINRLQSLGVTMHLTPGTAFPDEMVFEPPCSLKWMSVQHSLHLGAFSYAVSGFYFGCRIGRYCSIGEQVQIGRHPHPMHYFSTSPFFYMRYKDVLDQELPSGIDLDVVRDFKRSTPPVIAKTTLIGNDVWIGHGSFILPGVQIGDGAVIAAMSVVTKDVPPYAIVAGSPATVRKHRFPAEAVESLIQSRWWDFAPWDLKGAQSDDVEKFVGQVNDLRRKGVPAYSPVKIKFPV